MNFFEKVVNINEDRKIGLFGLTDEFFSMCVSDIYKKHKKNILILTPSLYEANKIYSSIKKYVRNTFLFPMDDYITYKAVAISPELKTNRLDTLYNIIINKYNIVVCHLESFLRFLPKKEKYLTSRIIIRNNLYIDRNELIKKIEEIGYVRETIVTNTGEFSVRGFVIDIYPINYDYPIRLEFFGDEIVSIRKFDSNTQLSVEQIEEVEIIPNTDEFISDCNVSNILEYMEQPIVIIKNYNQLVSSYKKLLNDIFEFSKTKSKNNIQLFSLDDFDLTNFII